MSFDVIYNIIAQDKFSRVANKVVSSSRKMSMSIKKLGDIAKRTGDKMKSVGRSMTTGLTLPLTILGGIALKQSANMETMGVALESMTGSAEKGRIMLEKLIQFTATTPFQLEGVGDATKTLLAFQVAQDKIVPTLRMLGDIAAGTGSPLKDMAQIFGKVKAKGKLMTEELLMLSERGIPIIDILAKGFNKTKAEVFEMASKSQISFDVMQKALSRTTEKGGVFFKQTERQSKTLAGVYSTLQDNASLAFAKIGDTMVKVFNLKGKMVSFTEVIISMTDSFAKFAESNPFLTKLIIILVGVLAVAGPLLIMIGAVASALPFLIAGFSALAVAVNVAALPVLAVGAALAAGLWIGNKVSEWLSGFPSLWDAIGSVINAIIHPIETVSNAFESMKSFTFGLLLKGLQEISAIFDKISSFSFDGVMDSISGFFGGGEANINATTNSSSTVDVNLNAPEGAIKSVKSRSRGPTSMNIGTNMTATM